jgi:hypothetical protein
MSDKTFFANAGPQHAGIFPYFLPIDTEEYWEFKDVIEPLERRRPAVFAFLRRIACPGFLIHRLSSGSITLAPFLYEKQDGKDVPRRLVRSHAKQLGMTEEEEGQFETHVPPQEADEVVQHYVEEELSFSEPWTWGPPRFIWQKKLLAETAAEA